MAQRTIYTRTYSNTSAGQLISGRGRAGYPLSGAELRAEFERHADLNNQVPTALVSVSTRVLDTIRRAFQKHFDDEEPAADIWIAFIEVPEKDRGSSVRIHAARELAERCRFPNPQIFHYERVFEWEIPDNYVLHQVSLQTLLDRGLDWDEYLFQGGYRVASTSELRDNISSKYECDDIVEIARFIADFARTCGSRGPTTWIASQLLEDLPPLKQLWDCFDSCTEGAFSLFSDLDEAFMDFEDSDTWSPWPTIEAIRERGGRAEYEMALSCAKFENSWRGKVDLYETSAGNLKSGRELYGRVHDWFMVILNKLVEESEARAVSIGL
ncbi:hypothetical protein F5Y10DRAFT_286047 [Nemania abortiva]|nr:hypothetical protein F5Y10DRAFT_286047 [Nemania abortiva]